MSPILVFLIGAVCGGIGMVCAACCVLAGRDYPEQPSNTRPPHGRGGLAGCHCDACSLAAQAYEIRALPEAGPR